jgi:hypothetical protein
MTDAIAEISRSANEELQKKINRLDKDLRPLQRAYFRCCYGCSDDARASSDVPPCISRCAAPMESVQEGLGEVQGTFGARIKRCHELAAESLPAELSRGGKRGPTDEELALYADKLRPCVREEIAKLPALVQPLLDAVPRSLQAVNAATPLAAGSVDGKKGWLW